MSKKCVCLIAIVVLMVFTACGVPQKVEPATNVTITIVYDNNPYDNRLTTDWGFSCVVQVQKEMILFDTGRDGSILLANMAKLGIDPAEIQAVVLSHIHDDHTGGLAEFLRLNNKVTVYMPASFPQEMKREVSASGANLEEIFESRQIFNNVLTTGLLDGDVEEQSLLIRTFQGLVVITGCAHPGIINVVEKAEETTKDRVYLVMGGFHLVDASPAEINSIAESLLNLGVEEVAPCHCSGAEAMGLFKQYFGENYIEAGVGRQITIRKVKK